MEYWMVNMMRRIVVGMLACTVITGAMIALAPLIGTTGVLAAVILVGLAGAAYLIEATRDALADKP